MAGIEAPWYNYHKKIYNLFSVDEEITIDKELKKIEDGSFEFTIASKNEDKLNAIEKLLGYGRVFGKVADNLSDYHGNSHYIVRVFIKYAYENQKEENMSEVYRHAFAGNPLFKEVVDVTMPFFGTSTYVVFKKDVVFFYDDNLSDYHGNSHYIVADLVKDVVANPSVYVCTESE